MAYVQGSLGEKISKTMDDAAALFKQGDYQQSIDMFARAWDLLPDSKYSYDAGTADVMEGNRSNKVKKVTYTNLVDSIGYTIVYLCSNHTSY